jgi:hypothetical protein
MEVVVQKEPADHPTKAKSLANVQTVRDELSSVDVPAIIDKAIEEETLQDAGNKICLEPQGGNVFVFDTTRYRENTNRCIFKDGTRWYHKRTTQKGGLRKVTYHVIDKDRKANSKFKKNIYYSDSKNVAMIHYVGDDKVAGKLSHGNSNSKARIFQQKYSPILPVQDNLPHQDNILVDPDVTDEEILQNR